MSRNFELLQQIARKQEVDPRGSVDPPAPAGPWLPLGISARAQVENLVQSLFLNFGEHRVRTVLFTSTEPTSRCNLICAHIVDTLASRVTESVCLIEASPQPHELHQIFGCTQGNGFADLIRFGSKSLSEVVKPLPGSNIYLLSASLSDQEYAEKSRDLALRMEEIREEFGFVVIVAPQIHDHAAALSLGKHADGAVLMVGTRRTRRTAAQRATSLLETAGISVLGAVVDELNPIVPETISSRI